MVSKICKKANIHKTNKSDFYLFTRIVWRRNRSCYWKEFYIFEIVWPDINFGQDIISGQDFAEKTLQVLSECFLGLRFGSLFIEGSLVYSV